MNEPTLSNGDQVALIVILCVLFGLLVFLTTHKGKSKLAKKAIKNAKGAVITGTFPHTAGLPIPEKTMITIVSDDESISFFTKKASYKLLKSRITDISIVTNRDIQQQYVSSVSGAIGGALIFGAVGALIGGRTKKKEITTIRKYLIFSYMKNNDMNYIGFDITQYPASANKFVRDFKKHNTHETVDL